MSSTTRHDRRSGELGQTLVLFVLSVVVILSFAALAFDAGQMLLTKRTQQDVADAAALAGARYIADPNCRSSPSLSNPYCAPAVSAALKNAQANGYGDGSTNCVSGCSGIDPKVTVKIPPGTESPEYYAAPGAIEVQIASQTPSLFAGVLGFRNWNVGSIAVAANQIDLALGYSILALSPNCPSLVVTGSNGSALTAGGNIQVDATCAGGLQVGNNAALTVSSGACNVSGPSIATTGHPTINCTINTGTPVVPDPLAGLPPPSMPAVAQPPVNIDNTTATPPAGCMGTLAVPTVCKFPSSYAGTRWRLFPGTYPGGIQLLGGSFYLQPGIYYIAGGGFAAGGSGVLVQSVSDGTTTVGGGILMYNTSDSSGGTTILAGGPIILNGSAATIRLLPYQTDPYAGMVIFQDRTLDSTVTLNGSSTNLAVSGTVYAPLAQIQVNGSGGTAASIGSVQMIAYSFQINGSGGNITANYDANSFFHIRGSGLVQ